MATPTGSRVNVRVFMHPLSFTYMLIWFWASAFAEYNVLDDNVARSYLRIGMLVLGMVFGLGIFFYQALRAMPVLSETILNPSTVASPAVSFAPAATSVAYERYSARHVVLLAVLVAVVSASVAFVLYERRLQSSTAFAAAVHLVSQSAEAEKLLGHPIETGGFVRGQVNGAGYAALAIPVSGPTASGTLYVVANRVKAEWDMGAVLLEAEVPAGSATRLDLTPPPTREAFSYPTRGRVYLQPLDDASAEDVKGLPAYYKARLDLDVVVLPTRTLAPETVDASADQVIAEKALAGIEQANRTMADDGDAVFLGVTSQDLNIRTAGWNFAMNYRDGRFGIVSTARLKNDASMSGANPAVYPVRVRKIVTKNLVLMRYPLEVSPDPTSAIAWATPTAADVDTMGERLAGESGSRRSVNVGPPCISVVQGPGGEQSWRVDCQDRPRNNPFTQFEMYPGMALLVMSRADFSLGDDATFAFVRKYRPRDEVSRSFGVGASDSYDIFPVGDSQTFSWIELILEDGARVPYKRTSPGKGVAGARLRADAHMGNPFSLSSLEWRAGWDLSTTEGWTYRFPPSGPGRTWQKSALIEILGHGGRKFTVQRDAAGNLQEVRAPDGASVTFTVDALDRIVLATESTGRSVQYEYDAGGRLAHLRDSAYGDEFYDYDAENRLTTVRNGERRVLLVNAYNTVGDIVSQTLANGERLVYQPGYNARRQLASLKLTLPNAYTIDWLLTADGLSRSWPRAPRSASAAPRR
ncbi:MAG TPA: cytochrome c oxidase assembly factor Coa1 family protein [Vicinamibacterales bacterium]|nr:cytochrome c oxidase assembly factor Coa1 family protein [Vicinamibacterales bacterium]